MTHFDPLPASWPVSGFLRAYLCELCVSAVKGQPPSPILLPVERESQ
jgi:hypothetical protein